MDPDDKRFVCIPHARRHNVTGLISNRSGIPRGVSQQTSVQRSIHCTPAVCRAEVKGVIRYWHLRRVILFNTVDSPDSFAPSREIMGDWYLTMVSRAGLIVVPVPNAVRGFILVSWGGFKQWSEWMNDFFYDFFFFFFFFAHTTFTQKPSVFTVPDTHSANM